jgi:lipoprotein-releasing system permease protein
MIMGAGVAYYLSASLHDQLNPVTVYLPRREGPIGMSLERAFNSRSLFPSGIFSIQQDFDSKYAIVPIEFARGLMEYENEVTALELGVYAGFKVDRVKQEIKKIVGDEYVVKNRFEQQVMLYKIMKSEKWAIFFILTFILIIAAFNVISSLTMLILDKKDDIAVLHSLGAHNKMIRQIFMLEGMMISIGGALFGLFFGGLIAWLQQQYGLISLGGGTGAFVINAYPVELQWGDFFVVFATVIAIGFVVAWYPVRQIAKKHLI